MAPDPNFNNFAKVLNFLFHLICLVCVLLTSRWPLLSVNFSLSYAIFFHIYNAIAHCGLMLPHNISLSSYQLERIRLLATRQQFTGILVLSLHFSNFSKWNRELEELLTSLGESTIKIS